MSDMKELKELERMRLWREAFNVYSGKCRDPSLCCDVADSTLKRFDETFSDPKTQQRETVKASTSSETAGASVEFKVGDKVRYAESSPHYPGDTGIVMAFDADYVVVQWSDCSSPASKKHLKLIK